MPPFSPRARLRNDPDVRAVAQREGVDPDALSRAIAGGRVAIMRRGDCVVGIGSGLSTKVNANVGTSTHRSSPAEEAEKAIVAERFGADTISDLSVGKGARETRRRVMQSTSIPLATVPVYEAASRFGIESMTEDDILAVLREQAREGVSAWVIHCITREVLDLCRRENRVMGIVSRGGSLTAAFMILNECENPFIEHFPDVLEIALEHGIVLSLGNSARCGCIGDGWGPALDAELRTNVTLAKIAHRAGVGVIIEGAGGHVRYDQIAPVVRRYRGASPFPLFVAGPIPTDIAPGFDHIAGCAGASAAAAAGADYLCAITAAEHLGLPGPDHVREGVIAFRIAAHIGDTVKLGLVEADAQMARMRAGMDVAGQIAMSPDPDHARKIRGEGEKCTMCGEFCALLLVRKYLSGGSGHKSPPANPEGSSRDSKGISEAGRIRTA